MRFIHIADVHLGVCPDAGSAYSAKRAEEIWDSFRKVIRLCKKEQTDLLLIAGDLFHRQPLLRELREVDSLFSQLPDTQVVLIAGNHDYIKKNSYYRTYSWSKNVHMLNTQELSSVELPQLDVEVYGFSYFEKEILEPRYHSAIPQGRRKWKILLAHGGDEKHIPINWKELSLLEYDYIALGHIHKPQEALSGRAAYAGALEPTDKGDLGPHGLIRGVLNEDGCRIRFVPFASREYIPLRMEVRRETTGAALKMEIEEQIRKRGIQNLYKLTLTGEHDPDIRFDPDGLDSFGNLVEITDRSRPAYDFEKLYVRNRENLLGKYIESFADCAESEMEYLALCEGVRALMETKRG